MHTKILTRLSLFASLLTLPAACGSSPNNSGLVLDWQVEDVGLPINDPVSCDEAGTPKVLLEVTNLSAGTTAQVFEAPCSAGSLITDVLPPGQYSVNVRLLRADNIEVSSIALPTTVVDRRGLTDLGGVIFEIQSFVSRWAVTRTAAPGVPVSCASVGATTVEFTATTAGLAPFLFRFGCGDAQGITQAVPDGDYSLQFRLLDAAGNPLSALAPVAYTTPVGAQAVLPQVTFTVN